MTVNVYPDRVHGGCGDLRALCPVHLCTALRLRALRLRLLSSWQVFDIWGYIIAEKF